jgi:glyoxylase-like metal-dependent hydrolase (beta-lactamase superfamily II)
MSTFLATVFAVSAQAATAPTLKLWRLDCGQIRFLHMNYFSDTYAYPGRSLHLVASCYLVQHNDSYLLWDTGLPESMLGHSLESADEMEATVTVSILDQLKRLNVDPTQIQYVGISHYHFDHIGQAGHFTNATLLIGARDADDPALKEQPDAASLDHWFKEGGKLERVTGDKEVFGDDSVIMLDLPGHTPGHHGLLVKLAHRGAVLLSGDAAHFAENYAGEGLPSWNSDRAQSLASMQRMKQIAKNLHATVVLQHDPQDVKKLAIFPEASQ